MNRVMELSEIPETLLVVGGGYIGLELGSVYSALGSRVTVVEMTDGLLPGTDRDLVEPLAERAEDLFEAVYLNTKVTSLAENEDGVQVGLEGEVDEPEQRFDRVLVAIGRRPNSEELGLEALFFFIAANRSREEAEGVRIRGERLRHTSEAKS